MSLKVKEYANLYPATSKNSAFTTSAINLVNTELYGFNIVWTSGSSLNGTVQLQVSVDGTNYANAGSTSALSGTTGVIILDESDYCYRYARLSFAFAAGSATINVDYLTKSRIG